MADTHSIYVFELTLGILIVLAILLRIWLHRLGLPSLVGFILLGFAVRLVDSAFPFVSETSLHIMEFLASTGVFILLFRIGLDSNLHGLVRKLPRAAPIWFSDVVVSGLPVFLICIWVFDLPTVPSMFTAVALTATSIAVTTQIWRESGDLETPDGETLVDVAELDDLSAVVLMAVALAIAPAIHSGDDGSLIGRISETSLLILAKAAILASICLFIAWLSEQHIIALLTGLKEPNSALILIGVGLTVAALASLLGFSIAIGAFFAGLVFSRNPKVVRLETSFEPLHAFFVPFFFIAIGFRIDPGILGVALALGGVLTAVAIAGKVVGVGLPAALTTSGSGALLIGVSMVPRAEVSLVVGQQAQNLGDWAMPAEVYSGIALVALATSLITPVAVHLLLRKRRRRLGKRPD